MHILLKEALDTCLRALPFRDSDEVLHRPGRLSVLQRSGEGGKGEFKVG